MIFNYNIYKFNVWMLRSSRMSNVKQWKYHNQLLIHLWSFKTLSLRVYVSQNHILWEWTRTALFYIFCRPKSCLYKICKWTWKHVIKGPRKCSPINGSCMTECHICKRYRHSELSSTHSCLPWPTLCPQDICHTQ